MGQIQLEITLADGHTIQGQPRPEDEPRLAELLGERSFIEFASNDDDLEGHAISGDVLVDVEGHAIAIRLPTGADAAALRRALAVGAVTASIVGAGAIAALQSPATQTTTGDQAPAAENVRNVPAPALRAEQAEQMQIVVAPAPARDAANPAVPSQAQRAGAAEQAEQLQVVAAPVSGVDASNPAVPSQAQRAGAAEQSAVLDEDNAAVPDQALRADQ